MTEETAKLLIEAMNKLAEALAKSGSHNVFYYHYPQYPVPTPYPSYPYFTCSNATTGGQLGQTALVGYQSQTTGYVS